MQRDNIIGKIASNTPSIMCKFLLIKAKSVELFLRYILLELVRMAKEKESHMINHELLIELIRKEEKLDFLKGPIC